MKRIEVVAAIIFNDNKILCVQRGENKYSYISKKYEFPGGKIENGEKKEEAIKREIMEELEMEIKLVKKFLTIKHAYPDFHLTMYSYICTCENPSFTLSEHINFKWLNKHELIQLDWAAADIPIVEKLMNI